MNLPERCFGSLAIITPITYFSNRHLIRFWSSKSIMRLLPVFMQDELSDELKDALKLIAQRRST